MKLKDYSNLKEMLIDFNEYSTDYTKTRCRELEETIKNTLKEIERLNKKLENLEKLNNANYQSFIEINNIINELKEWFKGYHKSYASCKWYEEDYIEFIEHLENELKGSEKE